MNKANMNETPKETAQENDDLQPTDIDEGSEESIDSTIAEEQAADASELETLQDELDRTKDQLMRALAEVENTRRRAAKERQDAMKFGISGFARDMLDVADNLARALGAVPEELLESEPQLANLIEGIKATERELQRNLEKNGVKKLNPEGEVFDPNFHEVMFETPGTGQPGGTIIQVLEVGYMLNDRLLRPARVGVAKDEGGAAGSSESPPTSPGGNIDTEA